MPTEDTLYKNRYRDELDKEEIELDLRGNFVDKNLKKPSDEDTQESADDTVLTPEEISWKKRYGDLRSHAEKEKQKLLREKDQEIARMKSELEATKRITAPKSDAELEQFREEYPELADVIASMTLREVEAFKKEQQQEIESLKKDRKEVEKEKVHTAIRSEHADWDTLKESDDFHNWLSEQPTEISSWIYGKVDAALASKAVKLYKTEKGIKTSKPKVDRASAAEAVLTNKRTDPPNANQKKVWKASVIDKMSGAEFERFEDEIMLAHREGRIENDI